MFSNVIERMVNKVIKERIAKAQKEYDNTSKALDEGCKQDIEILKRNKELDKVKLAEDLVKEILG